MTADQKPRGRISLAIHAMGGQGGGVLADWIQEVAKASGYHVQATSVPGVAQRTGSTVYYVEMIPAPAPGGNQRPPVLALMPTPGDVDIVLASELMEGGRAILRGFVTSDRTTLVTSTHRVYAISEKIVSGDGTRSSERIIETARRRSRRFIGFDMEATAARSGSVISSVMLGALAGSGALPFAREAYEDAIRGSRKAVGANLRAFNAGLDNATREAAEQPDLQVPATPSSPAGRRLAEQIEALLPNQAHVLAREGVRRLMDYQGEAYADLYLERLAGLAALDDADGRLTSEAARWLALWMAYEDTIRVADLKIRATRSARVASEVELCDDQVMSVTEYMHPRLQEICDILPRPIGRMIRRSKMAARVLAPLFRKGRHVEVSRVRWFLLLSCIAALRPIRPLSLRYEEEQGRIGRWLDILSEAAAADLDLAVELAACPRLIKGYSDTFERGIDRYEALMAEGHGMIGMPGAAAKLRALRDASLADTCEAAEAVVKPSTAAPDRSVAVFPAPTH